MTKRYKHNVKHGVILFKQSGKVHPSIAKLYNVSKQLEEIKKQMIIETPDHNIKKELLINDAVLCQGIIDLTNIYINKVGIFQEKPLERGVLELQPIIKSLASFMNTKRLNLMAVGLGSKADDALDVQKYIEKFDKEKETKEKKKEEVKK